MLRALLFCVSSVDKTEELKFSKKIIHQFMYSLNHRKLNELSENSRDL